MEKLNVITHHYMYRQMITLGWYLLVTAVQETCKANFMLRMWYRRRSTTNTHFTATPRSTVSSTPLHTPTNPPSSIRALLKY